VFPRSAKEGEPLMQVVALKCICPDEEVRFFFPGTAINVLTKCFRSLLHILTQHCPRD
jgi:hypothetical protein